MGKPGPAVCMECGKDCCIHIPRAFDAKDARIAELTRERDAALAKIQEQHVAFEQGSEMFISQVHELLKQRAAERDLAIEQLDKARSLMAEARDDFHGRKVLFSCEFLAAAEANQK